MKNLDKNEMAAIQGGELDVGTICLLAGLAGVVLVNPALTAIGLFCTGYSLGRFLREWE